MIGKLQLPKPKPLSISATQSEVPKFHEIHELIFQSHATGDIHRRSLPDLKTHGQLMYRPFLSAPRQIQDAEKNENIRRLILQRLPCKKSVNDMK